MAFQQRHGLYRKMHGGMWRFHAQSKTEGSTKLEELRSNSKLVLAPMMEYTDRHFRHLVRLISNRTLLYTEMVAANTLAYDLAAKQEAYRQEHPQASEKEVQKGYDDQFLRRHLAQGVVAPLEGPSVLQLGGASSEMLFKATKAVMDMTERGHCDYTSLNLNCGCPSPKVSGSGCFGAALMDDPKLVADLTKAMHDGCDGKLPVTVKCRIGTDSEEAFTKKDYAAMDSEKEYAKLCHFIETVASNGIVTDFSVHARIAVLARKFSPAENRKIPPLKHELVRRLVEDYPEFTFTLNGGIESLPQAQWELETCPNLSGVMIGRAFAADPWSFSMADRVLYGDDSYTPNNRLEVLQRYCEHADAEEEMGDPRKIRRFITKAISSLFAGENRAKKYRIELDRIAGLPKQYASVGKSMDGQPPISELVMDAATSILGETVLLRTPEETYERTLWEEEKRRKGQSLTTVSSWQAQRKQNEVPKEPDSPSVVASTA